MRVIAGSDHEAIAQLVAQEWRVSARADRQGIRLEGLEVASSSAGSILSRPVGWGTIQLPPDGFPIVLLADAQTVGGYRVLGTVISADLHLIGQLGPADKLGFELSEHRAGSAALRDRRRVLDTLPSVVSDALHRPPLGARPARARHADRGRPGDRGVARAGARGTRR